MAIQQPNNENTTPQPIDVREQYFKSYGYDGSLDLITSETRARLAQYADPLTLNFKWLINWSKNYGLFSDESNTNSALAYLKRIGEESRYYMLKIFISRFKSFIRDYDFLILSCEGLDGIVNKKPWEYPKEGEDKVTFSIRETSDMRIQSLLTLYRQIWFDDIACVEVLPANLRRFDCHVLIYNSGYFNSSVYDINENNFETYNDAPTEKKIYPTLGKLTKMIESDLTAYPFNHSIVYMGDVQFSNEDSGKTFFGEITNEMSSDFVKNTITVTYNFSKYSGVFYNVTGGQDFGSLLAIMAASGNAQNQSKINSVISLFEESEKESKKDIWTKAKDFTNNQINKVIAEGTPLGNALNMLANPNELVDAAGTMLNNAANAGIGQLTNKYIDGNLAKVNNWISSNFPQTLLTDLVLDQFKPNTGIENIEIPPVTQKVENGLEVNVDLKNNQTDIQKNITFNESNIYTRNTF